MKLKIFPTDKKKNKIVVEEVWRGDCQPENPLIQQVFDNWLYNRTESGDNHDNKVGTVLNTSS